MDSGATRFGGKCHREDLGETALHSDYLIRCALHRRAVAVHVSGLLDFLIHERASELYFKRRFEATPAGYKMVNWEQIQLADEHVWKRLAHETRSGCTKSGKSIFPADDIFDNILGESDFLLHLRPLPGQQSQGANQGIRNTDYGKKKTASAPSSSTSASQKRAGDKAGPSDPKQRKRLPRMPEELKGNCAVTVDNQAICFAFNMKGGCPSKLPAGARCSRGLHVCCKMVGGKACGEKHALPDHQS